MFASKSDLLTNTTIIEVSEVDLHLVSSQLDFLLTQSWIDLDRVKEHFILNHIPALTQTLPHQQSGVVDLPGDRLQSLWSMVHCIHGTDIGQQSLSCTDVTSGLVSSDVLLSCLKS